MNNPKETLSRYVGYLSALKKQLRSRLRYVWKTDLVCQKNTREIHTSQKGHAWANLKRIKRELLKHGDPHFSILPQTGMIMSWRGLWTLWNILYHERYDRASMLLKTGDYPSWDKVKFIDRALFT